MCESILFDKEAAFQEVEGMSMVVPSIFDTNAYKIIKKDFLAGINEGLEYKRKICICLNYKKSVSIEYEIYDAVVFEKSCIFKSDISDDKQLWICHSCDKSLTN